MLPACQLQGFGALEMPLGRLISDGLITCPHAAVLRGKQCSEQEGPR